MTLATLLLVHGGDDRMNLAYFWSAILIVLLPVAAFVAIAWWLVKMYRREQKPPV
jgi:lipopolysaccharide export LptBFGC system permease protein LptF